MLKQKKALLQVLAAQPAAQVTRNPNPSPQHVARLAVPVTSKKFLSLTRLPHPAATICRKVLESLSILAVMEHNSELDNTGITSEKLIETSTAWDGSALPDYPAETPVVSIYRYTFPPHTVTNPHYHKVINCGVVPQGYTDNRLQERKHTRFPRGRTYCRDRQRDTSR